jgi:hypothetical protein
VTRDRILLFCANDWIGFYLVNAGLTGLTHLDLFGARITDSGTNCLRCKCAHSEFDSYLRFNLRGAFGPSDMLIHGKMPTTAYGAVHLDGTKSDFKKS